MPAPRPTATMRAQAEELLNRLEHQSKIEQERIDFCLQQWMGNKQRIQSNKNILGQQKRELMMANDSEFIRLSSDIKKRHAEFISDNARVHEFCLLVLQNKD